MHARPLHPLWLPPPAAREFSVAKNGPPLKNSRGDHPGGEPRAQGPLPHPSIALTRATNTIHTPPQKRHSHTRHARGARKQATPRCPGGGATPGGERATGGSATRGTTGPQPPPPANNSQHFPSTYFLQTAPRYSRGTPQKEHASSKSAPIGHELGDVRIEPHRRRRGGTHPTPPSPPPRLPSPPALIYRLLHHFVAIL